MSKSQENLKKLIEWLLTGMLLPSGVLPAASVNNRIIFDESLWEVRPYLEGMKSKVLILVKYGADDTEPTPRQIARVPFDDVTVNDVADALYLVLNKCRVTRIEIIKEQSEDRSYGLSTPDGPVGYDEIEAVINQLKRKGPEAFL